MSKESQSSIVARNDELQPEQASRSHSTAEQESLVEDFIVAQALYRRIVTGAEQGRHSIPPAFVMQLRDALYCLAAHRLSTRANQQLEQGSLTRDEHLRQISIAHYLKGRAAGIREAQYLDEGEDGALHPDMMAILRSAVPELKASLPVKEGVENHRR
jgi:hypothetical protein